MRIQSSDQVRVAVHDFGGSGRPLLFSHATGFHAYCYLPIADRLSDRFHCLGHDHRGHGATARPGDRDLDWTQYGDDTTAVARALAPTGGLIGFGHSMGGTSLMMAAHRNPDLFDVIIAFEPIVFPVEYAGQREDPSPMVEAARNRRPSFESFESAIENFSGKPPMSAFDSDVLRLYVAHGFRPAPEGVRLKCDPETEATTFEQGARHRTWDLLPEIETPIVVIGGKIDGMGPAAVAQPIAEQLPNARFVDLPETTHLGPFIDPDGFATLIGDVLDDELRSDASRA